MCHFMSHTPPKQRTGALTIKLKNMSIEKTLDELQDMADFENFGKQNPHDGSLPLNNSHICFDKGHNMFLVTEIDNGRSKYGDHKCSRCGWVDSFQYDYGT